MLIALVIVCVFFLAYSNGANDNFKGVATLYGSNTASYRTALIWTSAATLLGSIVSITFATSLAHTFSGAGLVPDELAGTIPFLLAVGAAGAVTILLATILGMPTSTTHALVGAMVGAGIVNGFGSANIVNTTTLATKFAQPLLISPVVAVGGAATLYLIFTSLRKRWGIERDTCLCIGECAPQPVTISLDGTAILSQTGTTIHISRDDACREMYSGRVAGVNAQMCVDSVHYASSAAVSFARAVNDTPKIAIILLATGALGAPVWSLGLVTLAMVAGGLINSRKVAETMSKHITSLNPGQGLTANLTTAALVLVASQFGLPVSTTHVSCGSIFGIGLVNGKRDWKTIGQIGLTWLTTLPLGMAIGAGVFYLVQHWASAAS